MKSITADKAALRRQVRAYGRALSPEARRASDDALLSRFLSLPQVAAADTLLLYHGMGAEPDTARLIPPLLELGKRLALPRCLPERRLEARLIRADTVLIPHAFGMLEPGEDCPAVDAGRITLALIPGLAFDRSGGRLGQGGGYYDRWLPGFGGIRVALCRGALLFDALPRQAHDALVHLVVTEDGLYGPSAPDAAKAGPAGPASSRSLR